MKQFKEKVKSHYTEGYQPNKCAQNIRKQFETERGFLAIEADTDKYKSEYLVWSDSTAAFFAMAMLILITDKA